MRGGDLSYHLKRYIFSEMEAKFIISCIILAVEFLHNNGIIHRDIRPENILFDGDGYCKLADFCMAREWHKGNSSDTSGHPGYLAPEVVLRENQGAQMDFYQIGVVAHELMLKTKPYNESTRKAYKEKLINFQYSLKKIDTAENWPHEASDFINKCIKRKLNQRLGLNGIHELRNHIWFKDVDWKALQHRKYNPAMHFIPPSSENFD